MSPPDGSSTLTLNDSQADEDRMRAALGLTGDKAHQARPALQKPAREGVNFTVVSTRRAEPSDTGRARLSALESELKTERGERVAAQQALAESQRVIQQLQTKLAHTEIAAAESLQAERQARLAAEARADELAPAIAEPAPLRSIARKRGRPPGPRPEAVETEQEPVQWWLPSYAAARKKRGRPRS